MITFKHTDINLINSFKDNYHFLFSQLKMKTYKFILFYLVSFGLVLSMATDEALISDVLTEAESEVDQRSMKDLVDRMETIPGHARRGITPE